MHATSALPCVWRARADDIGRFSPAAAEAFREAAAQLDAALIAADAEVLTLEQAEAESGYSADHLRHLIASNKIANAGAKGRPRIRRKDLPKKATSAAPSSVYDATADAIDLEARRLARRLEKAGA